MNKTIFGHYTDYLLCSFSYITANGLAQLLGGVIAKTKLLAFWQAKKDTVSISGSKSSAGKPRRVLSLPTSQSAEKPYTDENELTAGSMAML